MTNSPGIAVNLVIVSARKAFVAKEVDGLVLNTRDILLGLDVLQAVGLVPAGRENIERDLAADRITMA